MPAYPNRSHAVMAQRHEDLGSLDNFPTPPWATRALIEFVIGENNVSRNSCLEPACGQGFMAKTLMEYFSSVHASDTHDYGYGASADFLKTDFEREFDWVITNPPFRLAEEFIYKALSLSKVGVAMLVRTVFIEGIGRYERLFKKNPPTQLAQFCERVPMVRGRLDPNASTATGYAWIIWKKNSANICETVWIPPCRKSLEKTNDYIMPSQNPVIGIDNFQNKQYELI